MWLLFLIKIKESICGTKFTNVNVTLERYLTLLEEICIDERKKYLKSDFKEWILVLRVKVIILTKNKIFICYRLLVLQNFQCDPRIEKEEERAFPEHNLDFFVLKYLSKSSLFSLHFQLLLSLVDTSIFKSFGELDLSILERF